MSEKFHWTDIHPMGLLAIIAIVTLGLLSCIMHTQESNNDQTTIKWVAENKLHDVKIEAVRNGRSTPFRRVVGFDENGKRHVFILSFSGSTFTEVTEINEESRYGVTTKP